MTQIAATIATMTLSTATTGKASAVAGSTGIDFSAMVAGLASGETGAPEGETATSDDTNAETGQELPTEHSGEQAQGQPVVQDLALAAAAQSAMADMVVPPPALYPVMQATSEGKPATEAIALDVTAPSSWRMATAERIPFAPAAATPVPVLDAPVSVGAAPVRAGTAAAEVPSVPATTKAMPALAPDMAPLHEGRPSSAVATPAIATPSAAVVTDIATPAPAPQAAPADTRAIDPATAPRVAISVRAEAAAPVAHFLRKIAAETPKAEVPQPVIARAEASPTIVKGVASIPLANALTAETDPNIVAPTGGATTDAGAIPMAATPAARRTREYVASSTGAAPLTTAELPVASITADMLRRRPELTVRPAAPVQVGAIPVPADAAQSPAVAAASDTPALAIVPQGEAAPEATAIVANDSAATPTRAALPFPSPVAAVVQTPARPADISTPIAAPEIGAEATVAAAAAAPAAPAVRPVMSALHRAAPPADASTFAVAAPSAGDTGAKQQDADTAPDQAPSGPAAATSAESPVAATPAVRAYADIVQSVPPVAQNAIGAVGNASAVTAPDIGATLENRVIDMSVGGQWIDRVAQEITQLAQGTGHSRFQLSPPHLGRIQIDIRQAEGGGSHVQMLTETSEAAQRLRDGQSSLQSDARLAALSLGTIAISHAASAFDMANDQGSSRQPSGDPNAQASNQGNQNGQGGQGGQSGNQYHQQPNQSAQTPSGGQLSQNGGQNGSQQGQQATQDGNSNGQGKSSLRRDVLEVGVGTATQEGTPARATGDRLVRYA